MKLSYLVDILEKLNILNLLKVGPMEQKCETKKRVEMFVNVNECIKTYKKEEQYVNVIFETI